MVTPIETPRVNNSSPWLFLKPILHMEKMIVSFSGGETSAYMAHWLWTNMRNNYDMVFVFANTGQENEQTFQFIDLFSKHFRIPIIWIEAIVYIGKKKGNHYREVTFETASRNGEPFHSMIQKHGIPNRNFPHCTRELKQRVIEKFARHGMGWTEYKTAIGIRPDEIDRINPKRKNLNLIYPLVEWKHMTKPKINFWWSQQPFRLELKGYQGNCATCWKKSDVKLYTIAKEDYRKFDFFAKMELMYGQFTPKSRLELMEKRGEEPKYPINFFRGGRSTTDILNEAKKWDGSVKDDAQEFDESCDVYSNCEDQK